MNGNFRSLVDRILQIKLVNIREKVSRSLDFELLNRTLIWNIISDFVIFLMPIAKAIAFSKSF